MALSIFNLNWQPKSGADPGFHEVPAVKLKPNNYCMSRNYLLKRIRSIYNYNSVSSLKFLYYKSLTQSLSHSLAKSLTHNIKLFIKLAGK